MTYDQTQASCREPCVYQVKRREGETEVKRGKERQDSSVGGVVRKGDEMVEGRYKSKGSCVCVFPVKR